MLPAIECDHLTGHRRQAENGNGCASDLGRAGATTERDGGRLPSKLSFGLPGVRKGRSRADGVDPDARRKRQGHGLGQRPQAGFGDSIRHEMRRQRPDALIDHVDDGALGRGRKGPRERLGQNEGCAQVRFHMRIPGIAGRIMPFIPIEAACVVD